MIGKVEALLDKSIDLDDAVLTRPFARVRQHVLDEGIGPLAVLHDFVEIALQRIRNLADLPSQLAIEVGTTKRLPQFTNQFDRDAREIVDEIEWVLDLVCDACRQVTERGELLRLYQTVLCGAQILQRCRQFARSCFYAFKQPHILDRNGRLVRKGRDQLDLLVSKGPNFRTQQVQNPNGNALA